MTTEPVRSHKKVKDRKRKERSVEVTSEGAVDEREERKRKRKKEKKAEKEGAIDGALSFPRSRLVAG